MIVASVDDRRSQWEEIEPPRCQARKVRTMGNRHGSPRAAPVAGTSCSSPSRGTSCPPASQSPAQPPWLEHPVPVRPGGHPVPLPSKSPPQPSPITRAQHPVAGASRLQSVPGASRSGLPDLPTLIDSLRRQDFTAATQKPPSAASTSRSGSFPEIFPVFLPSRF